MASPYAALSGNRLANASDSDLYQFALNYAKAHAMGTPQGVVGTGAAPGALPAFGRPVRLEVGRQSGEDAFGRRKALAASLARRTTESSRRRALERILAGYGSALAPAAV